MTQVKEERIKNEMIHRRFFDISTIQKQAAKRQLPFIVKVTCNYYEQVPMNLLPAWCNNKRQAGGVFKLKNKRLMLNIIVIIPTVDRFGSFK